MRSLLTQMRWQIAAIYTALIVLILAGLAGVQYALMRDNYLRTLERGLVGQAYLVASLTESIGPGASPERLDAVVDATAAQLSARVTLIDPTGRMVADSLLPRERYASRLDRPEILEALEGGIGDSQRYSRTTLDDRFYVAVPFGEGDEVAGIVRVGVPIATITTAQAQIALAVGATALLAAAVSFALAVPIAGRTTRPLLELRAMAERLAGGDLDVRVPLPPGEEVGALAKSFNQMAGRLRGLVDAQAREQERLVTILSTMHDGILIVDLDGHVSLVNHAATEMLGLERSAPFPIGELAVGSTMLRAAQAAHHTRAAKRAQLIDELAPPPEGRSLRAIVTPLGDQADPQALVLIQDLTELRRAERSRRLQLTNITHDLRTPLASLQALLDALVDGALDDPELARDFLGRMDVEVQGLGRLVNEFLELSRLELGQAPIERAPTDLPDLLREVADRMEAQARQKGVRLAIAAAPGLPLVPVDRGRIQQVLLNLLQNAVTYTPAGGSITLEARQQRDEVVVAVSDTGIGIAPGHLPHIFDRFYKADPSRSDGGVGLGLSIARHLVEHHGGRIWAESAPGRGTVIAFALPTAPDLAPAAR